MVQECQSAILACHGFSKSALFWVAIVGMRIVFICFSEKMHHHF